MASVVLADTCHHFFESRVCDLVFADFLVRFEGTFHPCRFLLIEQVSYLSGLVHVRFEIARLGEIEHVRVKCRHFRSNVVKEVGLLHMVSLDTNGNLIVQVGASEIFFEELLLANHHLDEAVILTERIKRFLGKTVSFERVQAEVGL